MTAWVRRGSTCAALAAAALLASRRRRPPRRRPRPRHPSRPRRSGTLEREAAEAARAEDWPDVLAHLGQLYRLAPSRYADGRFDFLTARALAGLGRVDEALVRFERYVATGDLFDVPARLAAARFRFQKGDGLGALELLFPLLQRKEGAVARRALRTALDALETRFDPVALSRLVAAQPRRRPANGAASRPSGRKASRGKGPSRKPPHSATPSSPRRGATTPRRRFSRRELKGREPKDLPDDVLRLLVDTARAQRDLELAERLAAERERRALAGRDAAETAIARFDLARLRGSRGRFARGARRGSKRSSPRCRRRSAPRATGRTTASARPPSPAASASTSAR